MKLTDVQKGWLAGLIDADGCILLRQSGKTYKSGITISNNSYELMQKLKETIPDGKVYELYHKKRGSKSYQFQINKMKTILDLLKQIWEFLVIKQKKAKTLMQFIRLRLRYKPLRTVKGTFAEVQMSVEEEMLYHFFHEK